MIKEKKERSLAPYLVIWTLNIFFPPSSFTFSLISSFFFFFCLLGGDLTPKTPSCVWPSLENCLTILLKLIPLFGVNLIPYPSFNYILDLTYEARRSSQKKVSYHYRLKPRTGGRILFKFKGRINLESSSTNRILSKSLIMEQRYDIIKK